MLKVTTLGYHTSIITCRFFQQSCFVKMPTSEILTWCWNIPIQTNNFTQEKFGRKSCLFTNLSLTSPKPIISGNGQGRATVVTTWDGKYAMKSRRKANLFKLVYYTEVTVVGFSIIGLSTSLDGIFLNLADNCRSSSQI